MIRIEVKSTEVRSISGTSKTGKPYNIRDQEAYAYTVGRDGQPRPYPERISLQLEDDQAPLEPGIYTLAPASLYVGDYGRLMLGRPQLVKAQPVAAAKAAA